ncbi:hypothetical protein [Salidesulfovibrio brasiliensis]|uniref:hypothetical protein n=1 Tax=Salidesulfovibrio brasiliensis TaxID=221711 RepID=UPI0006D1799A|nr:hypothetical protein [Salidesulfovibrio brasiliensis]
MHTTLDLAANYQVLERLRSSHPGMTLWEDLLPWPELMRLHDDFKRFSVEWFMDEGRDLSEYDGMSLASAFCFFLYYDLESWVRMAVTLEHATTSDTPCRLHLPNHDYLPPEAYEYLSILKERHGGPVEIVDHGMTDDGVESTLKSVLHASRAFKPLVRHETVALEPHELPNTPRRCLSLGFRSGRAYMRALAESPELRKDLHLVFDNNLSITPWIAPPFTKPEIAPFASFVQVDPQELERLRPEARRMGDTLKQAMRRAMAGAEFLPEPARPLLSGVFADYAEKVGEAQFMQYCYLREVVERFGITRTLNNLHDDAESYYCKHLMDKAGGKAFFQPHGLVGKDAATAPVRNMLAHTYFYYSEGERRCWEAMSTQDHDLRPLRHTGPPERPSSPPKNGADARVLVLADNFHCRLISKINYYQGQKTLLDTLASLGFHDVTVRLHGAFFNNYGTLSVSDEVRKRYFNGYPLDSMYGEPFADAVERFDLVIGPMSTCVYEALGKGVPFLAFTPGFRPSKELDAVVRSIWIDGLHPAPCVDAKTLREALLRYRMDPEGFMTEHRRSVERIGLADESEESLWLAVAGR